MKYIFGLIILVAVSGCSKAGVETKSTNNPDISVTKLFTNEGCSVYRFEDAGANRYYTNCSGSVAWQEQHGKYSVPVEVDGK